MISRISSAFTLVVSALCLSLAFSTLPSVVHAQDKPDPREILKLLTSAKEKEKAEDWDGALKDYRAAFKLYPDNSLLYRMGVVSENKGDLFAAVMYYERFIDAVPDDETAKDTEARLAELKANLPARITVETTPAGAEVYVGSVESKSLGTTPLTVDVSPGDISLFVQKEGYDTELRNVKLRRGEERSLEFEMVEELEETPVTDSQVTPDSDGVPLATWGWIATGVGVATLATGGVFTFLSQSTTDDVNKYDKRATGASPTELQELKDDANSQYDTSIILYVAGGVITATGVTLVVIDSMSSGGESALNLNFAPTRGGAAVGLSGQF